MRLRLNTNLKNESDLRSFEPKQLCYFLPQGSIFSALKLIVKAYYIFPTLLIFLLLKIPLAFCICDFTHSNFNTTFSIGGNLGVYDPFDNHSSQLQIKFELDNVKGSCNYLIALSDVVSSLERKLVCGINQIEYDIYTDASYTRQMLDYQSQYEVSNNILGVMQKNNSFDVKFAYVKVPSLQIVPYTHEKYSKVLTFDLYQKLPDETYRYEKSAALNLKLGVKPILNFALQDYPSGFTTSINRKEIAFDILPDKEVRQKLYFIVQHNTPYSVLLSSENEMKLINTNNQLLAVDYKLIFAGKDINLTTSESNIFNHLANDVSFADSILIEIVVPKQKGLVSGEYKDVIHIILQAE